MDYNKLFRQKDAYPIMGEQLTAKNTKVLNLTVSNPHLSEVNLLDIADFNRFIKQQMNGKKYGIGGYMENRDIYRRSEVFAHDEAFRNIHLGVDIWTEAKAPVYAPFDGKIHSFRDNAGYGNYGPTIILEHEVEGITFFTLYGHLMRQDLEGLDKGQEIKQGQLFCHLGEEEENGNWPPHLHFQLMNDMLENDGDFPGVSAAHEADYYCKICLDPNLLLRFERDSQTESSIRG
ncbi:peptidoglycan DD-metalloendopeptidase family protein [Litoribacter populi]|uniref:peptidoglycan DD-metalloendopeptidase family protein n=1 Tax=Litoribacter populi TaxID=2598460 RepID=UPI0011814E3E|nr:peptidoglycan DD-metalloendopeptidase family protein [Litoribacter populi]